MTLLTAELVEEFQQAHRRSRGVAGHVAGLRNATLTGLLEYGCLRLATGDDSALPPLPEAVLATALGRALLEVRSPLGARQAGRHKPHVRSVDAQEAEFHVLDGEEASGQPAWADFLTRFSNSAFAAGFSRTIADGLGASLQEMADNACLHSQSEAGALAGYHARDGFAAFCIADAGVGVLESLRSHPDFAHLRLHRDALLAALQDGASRFGRGQGGYGFRQVFRSLADRHGELRFRSGQGCVSMSGTGLDATRADARIIAESLPGFQVTVCCRVSGVVADRPLV